ncbi:MAG: exodeoxyribonuclease VII small subunit [Acidobacteria bacterium]|nr:exodeoxyribonuclease VII small subunit [Acidobacteriota bacterium]
MKDKPDSNPTFEQGLERLEQIVKELEQGDLALERALKLFEEGMQLSGQCRRQLEDAENKVELLLKKAGGKVVAEPFPKEEE